MALLTAFDPAPFAATDPEDPAYTVYTSGTSGWPKGVAHAQRAAWAQRMMRGGWYGLTSDDRVLHAGAFSWTYTLGAGLTDLWAVGATALIYAGPPDRHVWSSLAEAHRPTIFAAAPGVYRQMLDAPRTVKASYSKFSFRLNEIVGQLSSRYGNRRGSRASRRRPG